MHNYAVGKAVAANLKKAGYEAKDFGSATRAMLSAAQFAVDQYRKGKKSTVPVRGEYISEREKKLTPEQRENCAVACKMLDAIRGIQAHFTDPGDVGSSEIIRSTCRGHAGREDYY